MATVLHAATNAGGIVQRKLQRMRGEACQVGARGYYCVITKAGAVTLPPLSQELKEKTDGYRLYADEVSIVIQSASPRGVMYGWQDFEKQGSVPVGFFKENAPDRAFRAAHIDLRYGFFNRQRLKEIIDNLVELRYNTLILENENRLPFQRRPELVAEEHFTEEDLQWLNEYAAEQFLELIPLQQTLGHLEYALRLPQYEQLREVRQQPEPEDEPLFYPGITGGAHFHDFDEICPCNEEGYRLVEDLLDETMAYFPNSRYIHIGSDEAWNLLYCDQCRAKYGEDGKAKLLIEHVNRIARRVLAAGKTPIIWDDMLRSMSPLELDQLDKGIVVMSWLYHSQHPQADEFLPAFQQAGFSVLGAGSAKCSIGTIETLDVPDYAGRLNNVDWWSKACDAHHLLGFSMTVWSNYSGTVAPPHPQFETAWLPLAYGAAKMWDSALTQETFLNSYMQQFFGIDQPIRGLSVNQLLPAAKMASESAKRHGYEARMWYLSVIAAIYRMKSQFVIRELHRYNQGISEAEYQLLDRRVDEVNRLREWLKPHLEEALLKSFSQRETDLFMASRFEADEVLYRTYE